MTYRAGDRPGFSPARILAVLALAALPGLARAGPHLLARELTLDLDTPDLSFPVELASTGSDSGAAAPGTEKSKAPPGSLDFDLLGAPPPPPPVDEGALRLRRTMLTAHQGLGIVLLGLQLSTTVVGQLNYSDRFGGGPSTGRYEQSHKILAYSTLGVFATNGLLALLAPKPFKEQEGFDRVTVHKIAMGAAAAGMAAQAVLGIYATQREGYLNQPGLAKAHLIVGYVTLAAVAAGVGALVF